MSYPIYSAYSNFTDAKGDVEEYVQVLNNCREPYRKQLQKTNTKVEANILQFMLLSFEHMHVLFSDFTLFIAPTSGQNPREPKGVDIKYCKNHAMYAI